jgi:DNA-directed RNA polymerase sigma subunit (sigma70/sigma32)
VQELQLLLAPYLSPRELTVVTRFAGLDGDPEMSLREVGELIRTSHQNVSLIWNKAQRKLRVALEESPALAALMQELQRCWL